MDSNTQALASQFARYLPQNEVADFFTALENSLSPRTRTGNTVTPGTVSTAERRAADFLSELQRREGQVPAGSFVTELDERPGTRRRSVATEGLEAEDVGLPVTITPHTHIERPTTRRRSITAEEGSLFPAGPSGDQSVRSSFNGPSSGGLQPVDIPILETSFADAVEPSLDSGRVEDPAHLGSRNTSARGFGRQHQGPPSAYDIRPISNTSMVSFNNVIVEVEGETILNTPRSSTVNSGAAGRHSERDSLNTSFTPSHHPGLPRTVCNESWRQMSELTSFARSFAEYRPRPRNRQSPYRPSGHSQPTHSTYTPLTVSPNHSNSPSHRPSFSEFAHTGSTGDGMTPRHPLDGHPSHENSDPNSREDFREFIQWQEFQEFKKFKKFDEWRKKQQWMEFQQFMGFNKKTSNSQHTVPHPNTQASSAPAPQARPGRNGSQNSTASQPTPVLSRQRGMTGVPIIPFVQGGVQGEAIETNYSVEAVLGSTGYLSTLDPDWEGEPSMMDTDYMFTGADEFATHDDMDSSEQAGTPLTDTDGVLSSDASLLHNSAYGPLTHYKQWLRNDQTRAKEDGSDDTSPPIPATVLPTTVLPTTVLPTTVLPSRPEAPDPVPALDILEQQLQRLTELEQTKGDSNSTEILPLIWQEIRALVKENATHMGFLSLVLRDLRTLVNDDYSRLLLLRFCESLRKKGGSEDNSPMGSMSQECSGSSNNQDTDAPYWPGTESASQPRVCNKTPTSGSDGINTPSNSQIRTPTNDPTVANSSNNLSVNPKSPLVNMLQSFSRLDPTPPASPQASALPRDNMPEQVMELLLLLEQAQQEPNEADHQVQLLRHLEKLKWSEGVRGPKVCDATSEQPNGSTSASTLSPGQNTPQVSESVSPNDGAARMDGSFCGMQNSPGHTTDSATDSATDSGVFSTGLLNATPPGTPYNQNTPGTQTPKTASLVQWLGTEDMQTQLMSLLVTLKESEEDDAGPSEFRTQLIRQLESLKWAEGVQPPSISKRQAESDVKTPTTGFSARPTSPQGPRSTAIGTPTSTKDPNPQSFSDMVTGETLSFTVLGATPPPTPMIYSPNRMKDRGANLPDSLLEKLKEVGDGNSNKASNSAGSDLHQQVLLKEYQRSLQQQAMMQEQEKWQSMFEYQKLGQYPAICSHREQLDEFIQAESLNQERDNNTKFDANVLSQVTDSISELVDGLTAAKELQPRDEFLPALKQLLQKYEACDIMFHKDRLLQDTFDLVCDEMVSLQKEFRNGKWADHSTNSGAPKEAEPLKVEDS